MVTSELIIETATKLFITHGVKSITIDRIVKELHTSKRTIYSHFEDKITLLRACLDVYHTKIRVENEEIIQSADNVIEAMGLLHQRIVQRSHQVNPNFFSDIIHYYPGLLNESYEQNGNFAHQQLIDLAQWGLEAGIFVEDMDVEVVGKTVMVMLKLLKDNNLFPVTEFSKERLTFGILVPYLRGLCTPEGIELLQVQEELFRVSI
ncbi:MAG: TetR/AcrR family transcriptional regulator [Bacteroidetes bacterium]|nr:MAG: TetR/AcrR family transcriptional regulator [Bacteroidota bacterium]PTM15105.1 MAG: TetR/AcrR family transcriptional regulator [Bacteroidota bacterium]